MILYKLGGEKVLVNRVNTPPAMLESISGI